MLKILNNYLAIYCKAISKKVPFTMTKQDFFFFNSKPLVLYVIHDRFDGAPQLDHSRGCSVLLKLG